MFAAVEAGGPSIMWMIGAWGAVLGVLTAIVIVCYYLVRAVRHHRRPQPQLASWPPPTPR